MSYPRVKHVPTPALGKGLRTATRLRKYALLPFGLIVVFGLGLYFYKQPPDKSTQILSLSDTVEAVAEVRPKKIDTTIMDAEINALIAQHPGLDIGVAVYDIKGEVPKQYGVEAPFMAASVSKIISATLYLRDVEQGKASLDAALGGKTAGTQLEEMIVRSDNAAWEHFNALLTHERLAAYGNEIGFSNYTPRGNTIVVSDVALLLKKLYKGELLNRQNTELLLSYMEHANKAEYIAQSIPAGVTVYHKAGWLSDRFHDAAIIDNDKHPYVLVIFTKSRTTSYPPDGNALISQITASTVKAFISAPSELPAEQP